ncbi:MAG: type II toxin-antitoxin system VapC family toxin [bacterium]|nr:type II toxin-antitoxin system VapC family toxin [bacterium]
MIAFDTDVLTGILRGRVGLVERAAGIAADQQAVPVIVIEEIMRGRPPECHSSS